MHINKLHGKIIEGEQNALSIMHVKLTVNAYHEKFP